MAWIAINLINSKESFFFSLVDPCVLVVLPRPEKFSPIRAHMTRARQVFELREVPIGLSIAQIEIIARYNYQSGKNFKLFIIVKI